MNNDSPPQPGDHLTDDLTGLIVEKYLRPLEINADWMSYRHPDYPPNSTSLQEGRFNLSEEPAYYMASGDYCGQFEVPNHYERTPCGINSHTIYAFDLPAFATDYGHEGKFIQHRDDGGWNVCQELASYLTDSHEISGVLYQSAACHRAGQFGYCMVILPNKEQTLPDGFFVPRSNSDLLLDR